MTRESFDVDLQDLKHDILKMGILVEEMIINAMNALEKQDLELAEETIARDDKIDRLEVKIEDSCLLLIATQQPMAKDLRRIITGMKISSNLERIADLAVTVCKQVRYIGKEPLFKPLIDLPVMAATARKMVKASLDAYIREDIELARSLSTEDDTVDSFNSQIMREMLTYMIEDPKNVRQSMSLLFITRSVERMADHATNIGEAVVYLVEGNREDLNE